MSKVNKDKEKETYIDPEIKKRSERLRKRINLIKKEGDEEKEEKKFEEE